MIEIYLNYNSGYNIYIPKQILKKCQLNKTMRAVAKEFSPKKKQTERDKRKSKEKHQLIKVLTKQKDL